MSRKNEIDELFRNALSDKGMNYAPEYWEQMEALIAKRRKKVFKRVAWFSTGLLAIISAVILMILGGNEVKVEVEVEGGSTVNGRQSTEEIMAYNQSPNPQSPTSNPQSPSPNPSIPDSRVWTNKQGDDVVRYLSEKPALSLPKGSTPDIPESTGEDQSITTISQNPNPKIPNPQSPIPNPQSELTIPSLQPESLGNMLHVPQPQSTPLSSENPKKLLRRLPSYTQWYLGSYFNYGWIKHRYDPSIHTWKTTNEKVRPFMHYGINMRASKRGFSVSIGTGIRQWTERTNYTREIDHYTFDSSFRLINRNFIKRPDGTYAALVRKQIDTTSHTTTTEFICQDCPVTFRYITVPVAIHYEFGRGKWLGFTEAGMTFSFLSKSSGEYSVQWQNETGKTPGMQTDDLSGKYISPMVMQAGLAAGLSYRIHPFLSITGQFSYQRSMNSMMNLYRQESDFYGVGVGLEWKVF